MPDTPPETAICPSCGESISAADGFCPRCQSAVRLQGRYILERFLGSGGQGRTYAGRDLWTGGVVAVKELSLARARDWKSVDLFQRSAKVLGHLSHPGVPKLYESFEVERAGVTFFYLVQEFVEGRSLATALRDGERFDERQAIRIARGVLDILSYLHGRSPPLIHRDIKPSNIMVRPDGRPVLIDFDMVRDVLMPEGGSTMAVGTPGYAPLEQYEGRAVPATDLYALGATLVALLSRREPLELTPPGEHRIAFEGRVQVSRGMALILRRLLEPDLRSRYSSVTEVLRDLEDLGRGDHRRPPVHARRIDTNTAPGPGAETMAASRRRLASVLAATASLTVASAVVFLFVDRTGPESTTTSVTITESPEGGKGPGAPTEPAAAEETDEPALTVPEKAAARVEPRKASLVWPAKVRKTEGSPVKKGADCEFKADMSLTPPRSLQVELEVTCGAEVLYRSKDSIGSGVSQFSAGMDELPQPTERLRYGYRLRYHDIGSRIGGKPQITVDTARGQAAAWMEAPPWRVELDVTEMAYRTGTPLNAVYDPVDPGFHAEVVRTGRVSSVSGDAPVKVGSVCTVTVQPVWTTGHNCRVVVQCGRTVLYGEKNLGFNTCKAEGGAPVRASDRKGSASDKDPMLDLDLAVGRVSVSDDAPRAFSVVVDRLK